MPYKTGYDRAYIDQLLERLPAGNVILTGVSYTQGKTGVVVMETGKYTYYEHDHLPNRCHDTGDIYASVFVGAFMRWKSAYDAARISTNYTVVCIRATAGKRSLVWGEI